MRIYHERKLRRERSEIVMKKASVIIPTFNRAHFLKNAVRSVVEQDYPDIEIIIVDDRSTDNTVQVVNDLKKEYPSVVYRPSDRSQGPSGARNAGLAVATGEYVSFLDSDDVWLKDHLASGIDILESNPNIDVLFGNYEVVDYQSGTLVFRFFDKKKTLFTLPIIPLDDNVKLITGNVFEALIQENFFHLGSSIVSRRVLADVSFDERVTFAEDADFAVQLYVKNNARFAYRTKPAFILYRHGDNLTTSKTANDRSQFAHILLFTEYLDKYAKTARQRALLEKKISENLLERSYSHRLNGDHLLAFEDLIKSSTQSASWDHLVEASKILRSLLISHLRKAKRVVKAFLPGWVGQVLRSLQREYVFRRVMNIFLRDPETAVLSPQILADIVYGWGNDGFAPSERYLAVCIKHALTCSGPILECGSGLTTVLLGVIAQSRGNRLWALEHMPVWGKKVNKYLKRYRINSVSLHTHSLKDYGEFSWYDPPLDSMPDEFALVICDGPPGDTRGGRYGLAPIMREKLRAGCIMLLDDARRAQEKRIAARWEAELGARSETFEPDDSFVRIIVEEGSHVVGRLDQELQRNDGLPQIGSIRKESALPEARKPQKPDSSEALKTRAKSGLKEKISISILSQGLGSFLVLALSVFLARGISKHAYGTYQQLQMIASTIGLIGVLGMPQALFFYTSKVKDVRRLVDRTAAICLLSCLCFGVLFLTLRAYVAVWMNNPDIARLGYLAFLLLMSAVLVSVFEPAFISIGQSNRYYVLNILFSGMMFVTVLLSLFISGNVEWILRALVIQGFIASLILFYEFRRATVGDLRYGGDTVVRVREQLAYGIPLALAFIVGTIGKQIDRFIISGFFSPAEFAVYTRGAVDIPLIPIIVYSFSTILLPRYIALYDNGQKKEMLKLWGDSIVYVALLNFPAFMLLYCLSGDIIITLYSSSYQGSIPVLRGFLFMLLIQVTSVGGMARVIGKTRIVTYLSCISVVVNVCLGVILVRFFGVMGPVVATVVANTVGILYVLLRLCRELQTSFLLIWPWKKLVQVLLVSLASCSVFALGLFYPIHNRMVRIGVSSIMFSALYVGLLWISQVVPREEIRLMVAGLRGKIMSFFG